MLGIIGISLDNYLPAVTPNFVTNGYPSHERDLLTFVQGGTQIASLTLLGGIGNDYIRTGSGNDRISGLEGWDTLFGREGDDVLSGGAGNDTLIGGLGNDTLAGEADADLLLGDDGNDILNGGDGDDRLTGRAGNDTLQGGAGNDLFHGGSGADSLNGGAGHDTFLFNPTDSAVRIDFRFNQVNTGAAAGETYVGMEAVIGTNGADTFISGLEGPMFAAGGAGRDTFISMGLTTVALGGVGPDVFRVGGGLVLAVNIPGLTQENFHLLTQETLETALGLPLSDFSMIMVNPDSTDRLVVDGTTLMRVGSSFDFADGTWSDIVGAPTQTEGSFDMWTSFSFADSRFIEIGNRIVPTASGGSIMALREATYHYSAGAFAAYDQSGGVWSLMDTEPGINDWQEDPPDGSLVEWTTSIVAYDDVPPELWPWVEYVGGVHAFTWHMEDDVDFVPGNFGLVGGLVGASITAGMTLNIPLPTLSPPDWV